MLSNVVRPRTPIQRLSSESVLRVFRPDLLVVVTAVILANVVLAQTSSEADKAENGSQDILQNVKFRNLGPSVAGGRVTAVVGIPGQPEIYYVGSAGGGVFKTVNGGVSWQAIFEKQPTASIGAIAVAPSNPNLIWVGTGDASPRNDVITGRGLYFSSDAGSAWTFMGLKDAGQISSIIVSPDNAEVVFVGVLGRAWGRNPERGVYRTMDGGKTWHKVLYVDDTTGVSDMVMEPGNPKVLFAGMWQMQRHPWGLESGGPGSAIYRSIDGGNTWKKLTEGLPTGPLGRIGLAAAPGNPQHVYALVEAKGGVLWDSHDMGDHWKQVSNSHDLNARPFYFSHLFVSPDGENHVYILSSEMLESLDGGKTAHVVSSDMHVDHHALWIDPTQPRRIIVGNDGGVYVSSDAGRSWHYLDNLPIQQFYQVAVDDEDPYLLCGGLQDNDGWCGPSNSLNRDGITGVDWWTAIGGDGQYVVPVGNKTGLIYGDEHDGDIKRLDIHSGLTSSLRPYWAVAWDMPPGEMKFRFNWTSPLAVSKKDPNTLYMGANVLFKSNDGGRHWAAISNDLTRNDKSKQVSSGGEIDLDVSGAETYDTILSIAISPADPNIIWVGTDDGLVQVTRDGGEHWSNVTSGLKGLPEWGRVQQIEASPLDAASCYVAIDFHETDDDKPYVFRTHDYGKTWAEIDKGLPQTDSARVIREDPNRKGMLVVGTDTGLFYSTDDGGNWAPLKGDLPTVPVYDIKFVQRTHDLVVATHGRGLFVLDNTISLEEMSAQIAESEFHVFGTMTAHKWNTWSRRNAWNRRSMPGGSVPNPPSGAVIDYYLKNELEGTPDQHRLQRTPVKIEVKDAATGQHVRSFYGPSKRGINRAIWDLSYDGASRLDFVSRSADEGGGDSAARDAGPPVVPGNYNVTVTVNGKSQTQPLVVAPDPRLSMNMDDFLAQTRAALDLRDELSVANAMLNRLESLRRQLNDVQRLLASGQMEGSASTVAYTPVVQQAKALEQELHTFEEGIYNTEAQPGGDGFRYLSRLHDRLQSLASDMASRYAEPPSDSVREEMAELHQMLQTKIEQFNKLVSTNVAAFNKLALQYGANTLFAGTPLDMKPRPTAAGDE